MFFKNEVGDYVSLVGIDMIGVERREVPEAIDEPGGVWFDVYVDANGPGNRAGSYREEDDAREAARKLADSIGIVDIGDDDTVSNTVSSSG